MGSAPIIHERALVDSDSIGSGTVVWEFARVMAGAVIGDDCKIGGGVFVESGVAIGNRVVVKNASLLWHGVTLEDDVFIGPNVVFTNDLAPRVRYLTTEDEWLSTLVESGATVGANSTILCGISIGQNAMVGAGSVVTKSVDPHALMVGNPARRVGWVCLCGERLDDSLLCQACGRRYSLTSAGVPEIVR